MELPAPGDFHISYVGDIQIVVNRKPDGQIAAFVNACAHRGAQIVRKIIIGIAAPESAVSRPYTHTDFCTATGTTWSLGARTSARVTSVALPFRISSASSCSMARSAADGGFVAGLCRALVRSIPRRAGQRDLEIHTESCCRCERVSVSSNASDETAAGWLAYCAVPRGRLAGNGLAPVHLGRPGKGSETEAIALSCIAHHRQMLFSSAIGITTIETSACIHPPHRRDHPRERDPAPAAD